MAAVKLDRTAVVALLVSLDFHTANKWDNDRMAEKLKTLPKIVDSETDLEDADQKKLLTKILKAVEAEEEIEITGEQEEDEAPAKTKKPAAKAKKAAAEDDEDEEPAPKKKKAAAKDDDDEEEEETPPKKKGAAAKKTPAKKAAKKESEVEVDEFGTRLGTKRAKLNKAFSSKPMTLAQLGKKAGLEEPLYFAKHLKFLVEAGHIEHDEEAKTYTRA